MTGEQQPDYKKIIHIDGFDITPSLSPAGRNAADKGFPRMNYSRHLIEKIVARKVSREVVAEQSALPPTGNVRIVELSAQTAPEPEATQADLNDEIY